MLYHAFAYLSSVLQPSVLHPVELASEEDISLFQLSFDLSCFTEVINDAAYPENKSDTYFIRG